MKIRVAVLFHSSSVGGAELAIKSLIESTIDIYDWTIIYPTKRKPSIPRINGVRRAYYIPLPWWCFEHNNGLHFNHNRLRWSLNKLKRVAKKSDMLLTNTITIPWMALIANQLKKPHIWYVHEYGNIDHQLEFGLGYNDSLKYISETSTLIATISNNLKQHLSQVIPAEKIYIVHQAIDLKKFSKITPRQYRGTIKLKDVSIASVAAIKPSKGQHLLLEAIASLKKKGEDYPGALICGPVANEAYVKKLTKISGTLENANITTSFVDPGEIINKTDVIFVGSANEALGRGTLEGLASGRLVIGCDSGATKEILAEGRGVLFSPNKPQQIETIITNLPKILAQHDPLKGIEYVNKNYSESTQRGDFIKIVNIARAENSTGNSATDLINLYGNTSLATMIKGKVRSNIFRH